MKKPIIIIIIITAALFAFPAAANASAADHAESAENTDVIYYYDSMSGTDGEKDPYGSIIGEQYEASGAERLNEAVPDDIRVSLRCAGVELDGSWDNEAIDTGQLISELSGMLAGAAASPLRACAAAAAVITVCAMLGGINDRTNGSYNSVMAAAVTAASCCALVTPAALHIGECAQALSDMYAFTEILIPLICAVTLAGGGISESGVFSALMTPAAGMLSLAVNGQMLGLLRVFLALSCVSSLSGTLKLDGFIGIIEKNIKWVLTMSATVFLGILAAGCSSAAAYDRVKHKAFKLIVSGSVPVIGGPVSDALGSIYGCIGALKASVGSFAVIAVVFMLLPPIIKTAVWRLALELCAAIAGMFGVQPAEKLLRSCSAAMNVLLSFLVFTGVVIIGALACSMGGINR